MRRLTPTIGAVTGVLSLVMTASPAIATPSPDLTATAAVPARFSDQRIDWKPCFDEVPPGLPLELGRLECGSFRAPLDWNRPGDTATVKIAVSRLRASGGTSKGVVFTNPGGPGAPGLTMPVGLVLGLPGSSRLVTSMDIIGIDVRGTGDSTTVTCGFAPSDGEQPDSSEQPVPLEPRDRSPENIRKLLDIGRDIAEACQRASASLGPHINTANTVQDLDLLRGLLDVEKMNWLGYSGGTWLGAHYATAFPQRVGRFVLDSNTAFTSRWQKTFDLQPLGFERRFRQDFTRWAAEHDDIYGLGRSGRQVRGTYEKIRASLAADPLPLLEGGHLFAVDLDSMIAQAMYRKDEFPELARVMGVLRRYTGVKAQDATRPSARLVRLPDRATPMLPTQVSDPEPSPAPDAFDATFFSVTCNDTPYVGTEQDLVKRSAAFGKKYPLLGWLKIIDPCQYWKRPDLTLPTPTGKGLPPVLMVQSVRDPATPYEGALAAHRSFAGSRLLTVTDEGDHGIYAGGNGCVDEIVEDYLVDGTAPAKNLTCKGLPLPEPPQAQTQAEATDVRSRNPLLRIAELNRRF